MGVKTADMAELDDRDREVLRVLADGRANPLLIREETDLDKGETNTVLVRLGRGGYVEQVTRGLYEITEKGRAKLGVETTEEKLRDTLQRLENALLDAGVENKATYDHLQNAQEALDDG